MKEIGVALVGYNFMGRAHSNAYRQVTHFFQPRLRPRLKVVCGRDPAAVSEAAGRLGFEESATDWRDVIGRKDIGLVDICTPSDSHAEIAIAAARAGKAVLCEKPLANSVRDARAMLKATARAKVVHMVCHNYRRAPAVMLARRIIEEGRLGRILHFRGAYLQDWLVDPAFPLTWRLRKEVAGSGALGDLAAHSIDLARFLVGEITEVTAALETFVKERPLPDQPKKKGKVTVDDAAAAVVRFANGALGTIEATRMAPGRKNYNHFEINGSLGSLAFDLERLNELQVFFRSDPGDVQGFRTVLATEADHHSYVKAWWPPGHALGYEHTFVHTVYDLLEGIADHKVPQPSFADGLANQQVLAAMEKAARTRRWVGV
jgi:predicted dehydrogenase